MKPPDEAPTGVPHDGASGGSAERAVDGARAGLLDILIRFAEDAFAGANGLLEVKADRMRLSVRRTMIRVVLATGVALCASLWLGAAVLATLRGLCGWFTALGGGREWVGELCGGVLGLLLAAGAAALFLKLSARRELIRLEVKYERIRNKSGSSDERGIPPENGGGTARSRGSAGAAAHQRNGGTRG